MLDHNDHDDHGGLHRDMPHLLGRRDALRWMGGMSLAGLLAACGVNADPTTTTSGSVETQATPTSSTTIAGSTSTTGGETTATTALQATIEASAGAEIPDEAAGPFPADGSNGPNVLNEDGVLKQDIRSSFGSLSGIAEGVPLSIQLAIVDAASGNPTPGAVVYIWHCTADGRYSIYEIADQNYLRGVQVADDAGRVAFTTVFPGCYPGRWPHAHFEVFASLDEASARAAAVKTSQLALPRADCETVYADSRYTNSAAHLTRLSLDSDIVFRDGWSDQLATVAGSVDTGLTASLLVRV